MFPRGHFSNIFIFQFPMLKEHCINQAVIFLKALFILSQKSNKFSSNGISYKYCYVKFKILLVDVFSDLFVVLTAYLGNLIINEELDSVATPRSDVFVYLNANENVIRILLRQT
jgi:hypothetical protein